jgi:Rnl2 family RNA ligase
VSTFHKYPDTVTLAKRPEVLSVKQVVATEKLHGTNFRVFFPAAMTSLDDVRFGGRNEVFESGHDGFYGGRPVRWFKERPELMGRIADFARERGWSDVILYGEACGAGIQKGVRYVEGDEVVFRAFDVCVGDNFLTYDLFVDLCDAVGLPRVPEVWRGEPSLAAFDALLEQPSLEAVRNGVREGAGVSEGVVIRSNPLLRNVFGEWLIVKHKSQAFAESARPTPAAGVDRAPVETFVRTHVLRGRVVNALGRLRDAGVPVADDMQDLKHLVPALVDDLRKECGDEWGRLREQGFKDGDVRSTLSRVLAGLYRQMLNERVG